MRKLSIGLGATALLGLGACAEGPQNKVDDFGYNGTGIEFTVAPLTLDSLSDACYSFTIENGATPRELVVGRGPEAAALHASVAGSAANTICASQFGNTAGGDISYVAPCDAQEPSHLVTLWVDLLCATGTGSGCTEIQSYVDPCPSGCELSVECVENADTPVTFNFTIMGQADQGFFDIAVNFENVFCSAKFDNCYPDGPDADALPDPIVLLHNASGERDHTAIAAVACTAGPNETTTLHYENFVVECAGVFYTLDLSDVTQEGNLVSPINATLNDGGGNTLPAAIYFGTEALPNGGGAAGSAGKVYTNIAFLPPDGVSCKVNWFVVPSTSTTSPQPSNGSDGTFTQVAGVRFAAGVTNPDCTQDGLDDGGGVASDYETDPVDYTAQLTLNEPGFVDVVPPPPAAECTQTFEFANTECEDIISNPNNGVGNGEGGDTFCPESYCTFRCITNAECETWLGAGWTCTGVFPSGTHVGATYCQEP